MTVEDSFVDDDFITKDVADTILAVGVDKKPCVPPAVATETNILLVVNIPTALTVTVPAANVAVPTVVGDADTQAVPL